MPRGMDFVHSYSKLESRLPSPRKVSWELHHDGLYPFGDILSAQDTLGSDPTCAPDLRFAGCDSCEEPTCQNLNRSKTCEFNQPCPNDGTTAARLGGNGALVTHMVSWKILAKLSNTFSKVMQFGQFVAHSFSMTSQAGDLIKNQKPD